LFENGKIEKEGLDMDESVLKDTLSELRTTIEECNLFQAPVLKEFQCPHNENLKEIIGTSCSQLILELTEACNLRCRYCIYGDSNESYRAFSNKKMNFETAKMAMDMVIPIAAKEGIALTFYGGEPLIEFHLMKECIEYFKANYQGEVFTVNFTTNLTLMTKEIADYLYENRVSVTCSLDGNRSIHDSNRVYQNGRGSFDDTIRGLKLLLSAYGDHAVEYIIFNMVMDAPFNNEKFVDIGRFFEENDWIPKDIHKSISYAEYDIIREAKDLRNMDYINDASGSYDVIGDWTFQQMTDPLDSAQTVFSSSFVEDNLRKLHERRITKQPMRTLGLNGCCIPGEKRLYVTVDGDFKVCEKAGEVPVFGNVKTGFDYEAIKKYYVEDYEKQSLALCNDCWAANLCGVCYAPIFREQGLDINLKKDVCNAQRQTWYNTLIRYHELAEIHPELLDRFNKKESK
ncbi:MAG: radical SAM protein, partial [Lachnospiraceae bacterium]|nr:radical SAM protein [Lachnospiraceae bacterium]